MGLQSTSEAGYLDWLSRYQTTNREKFEVDNIVSIVWWLQELSSPASWRMLKSSMLL
jgi:hypothetical protein